MTRRYILTDHVFTVPLDHDDPHGETIEVFAREVADPAHAHEGQPWLVYLQGGPGSKAPRPGSGSPAWLEHATRTHRVLLLDQRGTGRSTPVTPRAAARLGTGHDLARHLSLHRADSIVRDAELIRQRMLGGRRWSTLGQSFGGFITLTYLSQAPEALEACYITGGLPGLDSTADYVYRCTYPRVAAKNAEYYERYPDDANIVRQLADLLDTTVVCLPDGDQLTVGRLRALGLLLGMGHGFERLHWMLEEAFIRPGELSEAFLLNVLSHTCFADNPLYTTLQEACYGQGSAPTRWAAKRIAAEYPAFDSAADPLLFTGEMVYPWMFREVRALRPFAEAADILARSPWPALYDPARLAENQVPLAAIVYHDDMYVPADISLRTAERLGTCRVWVTNEWEHDGLSTSGATVLARLMDMAADYVLNGG
jgi:pimeloyl-ACP methyl ester carboxylesterase